MKNPTEIRQASESPTLYQADLNLLLTLQALATICEESKNGGTVLNAIQQLKREREFVGEGLATLLAAQLNWLEATYELWSKEILELKDKLTQLGFAQIGIPNSEQTAEASAATKAANSRLVGLFKSNLDRVIEIFAAQAELLESEEGRRDSEAAIKAVKASRIVGGVEYHGVFSYYEAALNAVGALSSAPDLDTFLLEAKKFNLHLARLAADSIRRPDETANAHLLRFQKSIDGLKRLFVNFETACFGGSQVRMENAAKEYSSETLAKIVEEYENVITVPLLPCITIRGNEIHLPSLVRYLLLPLQKPEETHALSAQSSINLDSILKLLANTSQNLQTTIEKFCQNKAEEVVEAVVESRRDFVIDSSSFRPMTKNEFTPVEEIFSNYALPSPLVIDAADLDEETFDITLAPKPQLIAAIANALQTQIYKDLEEKGALQNQQKTQGSLGLGSVYQLNHDDYFARILQGCIVREELPREGETTILEIKSINYEALRKKISELLTSIPTKTTDAQADEIQATEIDYEEKAKHLHVAFTMLSCLLDLYKCGKEVCIFNAIRFSNYVDRTIISLGGMPQDLKKPLETAYWRIKNRISALNPLHFPPNFANRDTILANRQSIIALAAKSETEILKAIKLKTYEQLTEVDNRGYNALHIAAGLEKPALIKAIIAKIKEEEARQQQQGQKSAIFSQTKDGKTALQLAALYNSKSSCETFLQKFTDADLKQELEIKGESFFEIILANQQKDLFSATIKCVDKTKLKKIATKININTGTSLISRAISGGYNWAIEELLKNLKPKERFDLLKAKSLVSPQCSRSLFRTVTNFNSVGESLSSFQWLAKNNKIDFTRQLLEKFSPEERSEMILGKKGIFGRRSSGLLKAAVEFGTPEMIEMAFGFLAHEEIQQIPKILNVHSKSILDHATVSANPASIKKLFEKLDFAQEKLDDHLLGVSCHSRIKRAAKKCNLAALKTLISLISPEKNNVALKLDLLNYLLEYPKPLEKVARQLHCKETFSYLLESAPMISEQTIEMTGKLVNGSFSLFSSHYPLFSIIETITDANRHLKEKIDNLYFSQDRLLSQIDQNTAFSSVKVVSSDDSTIPPTEQMEALTKEKILAFVRDSETNGDLKLTLEVKFSKVVGSNSVEKTVKTTLNSEGVKGILQIFYNSESAMKILPQAAPPQISSSVEQHW